MKVTQGIRFDEHEEMGYIEVHAILPFSAHTRANINKATSVEHAVESARNEAVKLIMRQVYGDIEDAIRNEINLFESLDYKSQTVRNNIQLAIATALKRLLTKVDNNSQ